MFATSEKSASGGGCCSEPPSADVVLVVIAKNASGDGCCGEPPSANFCLCRDCEEHLGGWLLRRAPECQFLFMSRLRRRPRGVAGAATPRVPIFVYVAIVKNTSGGGCCGEPPSANFCLCRDCEEGLGVWLVRRPPECQFLFMSRLRRTPRGVAVAASPRVPIFV